MNEQCRWPSDPTIQTKWNDAIRDANNCACPGTGFVCGLHFLDENIEKIGGKIQLKEGSVPTEFWVDINDEPFENESECEMDEDFQVKYNELQQLYLEKQLKFNMREISLQEKNKDLERKIQLQAKELSALKKSLASNQTLIEQMKNELVRIKTSTSMSVSVYIVWFLIIYQFNDYKQRGYKYLVCLFVVFQFEIL